MNEWLKRKYKVEVRYPSGHHVAFPYDTPWEVIQEVKHLLKINKARPEPFTIILTVEQSEEQP